MRDYNELFEGVKAQLKLGKPVSKTLKWLGISGTVFYKNITQEQKDELKRTKILSQTSGCRTKRGIMNYDSANFEINEE